MKALFPPRMGALRVIAILVMALITLSGCNLPQSLSGASPSLDVTAAMETITARMTEQPATLSPVPQSPVPTVARSVTAAPRQATITAVVFSSETPEPTRMCDLALAGVPIDVTIPDDTEMQPNQSFTKVWRLQNGGACTWSKSYTIEFFSGERMGAQKRVPLPREVPPGQSVDISVDMTSPDTSGKFQGNWKLRNDSQELFGIGPNGSAPFWVRIIVPELPTETPTPPPPEPSIEPTQTTEPVTPTATLATVQPTLEPTAAITPTQTIEPAAHVIARGHAELTLGDQLDLDGNQVNPADGADLVFESGEDRVRTLAPLDGALIGVFGENQPNIEDCHAEALGSGAFLVQELPAGMYLCYRTGAGMPGWLQVVQYDSEKPGLTLQLLTWAIR